MFLLPCECTTTTSSSHGRAMSCWACPSLVVALSLSGVCECMHDRDRPKSWPYTSTVMSCSPRLCECTTTTRLTQWSRIGHIFVAGHIIFLKDKSVILYNNRLIFTFFYEWIKFIFSYQNIYFGVYHYLFLFFMHSTRHPWVHYEYSQWVWQHSLKIILLSIMRSRMSRLLCKRNKSFFFVFFFFFVCVFCWSFYLHVIHDLVIELIWKTFRIRF